MTCLTLAQPRWGSKKWLVSGGEDATAIAWSVPHGEPIHRFSLPMPPVALVPCEEFNSISGDNLAWMGCLASLDESGGAAILSLEPRGGRVLSSLPAPPGKWLFFFQSQEEGRGATKIGYDHSPSSRVGF